LDAAVKDESSGKLIDSQWSFVLASAGVASMISKWSPSLDPTGKKTSAAVTTASADPAGRVRNHHYAHFSPAATIISH